MAQFPGALFYEQMKILDSTHHSLSPSVVSYSLGDLCAGTIIAAKWQGDVLIELG
jgi:hypothetical protein